MIVAVQSARVADITYVAISAGFVYVAVILDAWSRRVLGYAISRFIDARLMVAALEARSRGKPLPAALIRADGPCVTRGAS